MSRFQENSSSLQFCSYILREEVPLHVQTSVASKSYDRKCGPWEKTSVIHKVSKRDATTTKLVHHIYAHSDVALTRTALGLLDNGAQQARTQAHADS